MALNGKWLLNEWGMVMEGLGKGIHACHAWLLSLRQEPNKKLKS